jgi:nucleotide-binding universal stress UspA family protein
MSEPIVTDGILVGFDGSPESDLALRWAAHEAVLRKVPVHLMHVIAPLLASWPIEDLQVAYGEWQDDNAGHVIEQAEKVLLDAAGESGLSGMVSHVRHGDIVKALARASAAAQLTVVGSRGLGPVAGALLGSVSRGLLYHSRCPIAVVHARGMNVPDGTSPVAVGIDGSPASESAIALAFDEASRRAVDLVAIHAWSDVGVFPILGMDWHQYEDQGHELIAERLAGWQEQYPDVRVRRRIVCDRPARWLIDESKQAQLVVVGSRGRGGFDGLRLGSVSAAVAESAKCPVVVVRPDTR